MEERHLTLADFRKQISFRFIQPKTRLPGGYGEVSRMFRLLGFPFDILNTRLPPDLPGTLREIWKIPRMSTVAISAIINWGVGRMPEGECFVNVGVWQGFTFLSGIACHPAKAAVGIDNFSMFGGPRDAFNARFNRYKSPIHRFYEMDFRHYFQQVHRGPIGFYIYDGDHCYEHQLEAMRIADPFFAKGALVLVDDTNLPAPRKATLDFVAEKKGQFQVVLDEPTRRNCHPTFWNGIVILQKLY